MSVIAIVGIGLRVPGSSWTGEFWENLAAGRQIRDSGDPLGVTYTKWGGFDWRAFKVSPVEAQYIDPQTRLLMELAWEATEDAGLSPEQLGGERCGVYVGLNSHEFLQVFDRSGLQHTGYSLLGMAPALAANRISYTFDLRGPSKTLNVGCASSLFALHEACGALEYGDVTTAVVGAVELPMYEDRSDILAELGMISPTGQCRSLDRDADGYVRAHGGVAMVLKRLTDVGPGERVYAVIRGSGVSHNGRNEWIFAPSAEGQADALRRACGRAGVAAHELEYVEMHGAALPKGDLEESRALSMTWAETGRRQPCRLGSVSNSIGYLGAAGGMAAAAKLALSIHHRTFVPTVAIEAPNPAIPFDRWGLTIQRTLESWPESDVDRLGAVMVTSLGGANAALVMSGAPPRSCGLSVDDPDTQLLVPISAHNDASLRARIEQLRQLAHLSSAPPLAEVAHTLIHHRSHRARRCAVLASTYTELNAALSSVAESPNDTLRFSPALDVASLPTALCERAERYLAGQDPSVAPSMETPIRPCVSLPPYPFDRRRLWPKDLTPPEGRKPLESRPVRLTEQYWPAQLAAAATPSQPVQFDQVIARVTDGVRLILELPADTPSLLEQSFVELGFDSMSLFRLRNWLEDELGLSVPIPLFFEAPRIELFAHRLLQGEERLKSDDAPVSSPPRESLAVSYLTEEEAEERLLEKLATLDEIANHG
ncbi:MAG: phosphopantetheine-binding protein [Proteobacteria bacterium]|nr:phosphopantetheine-binding protein [Pseudomonadota bacterium]